jgi:two-component system LytT family sensor kinase
MDPYEVASHKAKSAHDPGGSVWSHAYPAHGPGHRVLDGFASAPGQGRRSVMLTRRPAMLITRYIERSPIPIRTVFLWAFLLAVLFVFTSFIHRTGVGMHPERFDWISVTPIPFLNFFTWALLVPLVNQVLSRWPLSEKPVLGKVFIHLVIGLSLGVLQEVFTNFIYLNILAYAGRFNWTMDAIRDVLLHLPGGILQRTMEYWLLLVILMYARSNRQMAEKRTQLLELQNQLQAAELNSLKKQLQPHFLFNALNTVSSLMEENMATAQDVLSRLGEFLRATLEQERLDRVPLLHELDTASHYLAIETARYKDRLKVVYRVSNDCHDAMVPGLILQPLVENSIKHGVNTSSDMLTLEIAAMRSGDQVWLVVTDDGKGCADPDAALERGGIGLRNVRQRMALLYGDAGVFKVTSGPGQGFKVSIGLPYSTENAIHRSNEPH